MTKYLNVFFWGGDFFIYILYIYIYSFVYDTSLEMCLNGNVLLLKPKRQLFSSYF